MNGAEQPRRKPGRPPSGKAQSAAERMRRYRQRRREAGLKPVVEWRPGGRPLATPYSAHRLAEARSLAMHVLIAQKMLKDSSVIDHAKRNLRRWKAATPGQTPRWHAEWAGWLRRRPAEVAGVMTELTERAARLRQSSPFAGVLDEAERRRIYDAFRA